MFLVMAYVLDEEKARRSLSSIFKSSEFYLESNKIIVSKSRVESASFLKLLDLNYQVSGMIKISIIKEDGEYENLYHYNTKISVNEKDEVESCDTIYLNKLV